MLRNAQCNRIVCSTGHATKDRKVTCGQAHDIAAHVIGSREPGPIAHQAGVRGWCAAFTIRQLVCDLPLSDDRRIPQMIGNEGKVSQGQFGAYRRRQLACRGRDGGEVRTRILDVFKSYSTAAFIATRQFHEVGRRREFRNHIKGDVNSNKKEPFPKLRNAIERRIKQCITSNITTNPEPFCDLFRYIVTAKIHDVRNILNQNDQRSGFVHNFQKAAIKGCAGIVLECILISRHRSKFGSSDTGKRLTWQSCRQDIESFAWPSGQSEICDEITH
ncbi:protein of unknown function [Sterolibacterium denitrificans]|uniref:Uncharacterized protein n=1 Tax=Sterolibacterium denitrificans TaxID=157592 RepID=A0A7Z7MWG3_9PROT|nr:protein of unknown function [Sterolibacterium denitrificans]